MLGALESMVESLAAVVPLEVFVTVASILEEVLAPIPSPTVMMLTGALASVQDRTLLMLVPLLLLGTIGKTLGASVVYVIADRGEDLIIGRFGRYFGVTREDVEAFGDELGTGARGYFLLTLFRALPVVPSTLVSVGSGLIKVPYRMFLIATLVGTIVRDGFYLYAGYIGTETFAAMVNHSASAETYIEAAALVVVFVYIAYRLMRQKRR
ncbi:MAG TPA: VTT domain-containing protein [Candidatus Paceibacterota bacterium]|nr:VTT domain-containing protein [Candidatus Paceibacterota bacterium]